MSRRGPTLFAAVSGVEIGVDAMTTTDADPTGTGPVWLLPIDAATYVPHEVHASERVWTETNCYIDVWVEVLHALGHDPIPAMAAALASDFQGDQWLFVKFDLTDLRTLYGIDVNEMNVWRPTIDHVEEQLRAGRLMTIEADSWFLPDTAGVSYQLAHAKSTIVPQSLDRATRRLGYFHNAGYFELSGDDFDGVFRLGPYADDRWLPPYAELVRFGRAAESSNEFFARGISVIHRNFALRPEDNPAQRLIERLRADMVWLAGSDVDTFHRYAFGMIRQFGVAAELSGTVAQWVIDHVPDNDLDTDGRTELSTAAERFFEAAGMAKSIQFRLARLVSGRKVDIDESLDVMAVTWQTAMDAIARWAGR